MPVVRPRVLVPAPSLLMAAIGGIVATVLFAAIALSADALRTLGGIFTSHATVALAIGSVIALGIGVIVAPAAMVAAWSALPGKAIGIGGALTKGATAGVAVWLLSGLTFGIAGAFNRVPDVNPPGLFAARAGFGAAAALMLGSIVYGIAVAAIAAMERALSPIDALGWKHFYHAAVGPKYHDEHRSIEGSGEWSDAS
jgi:hypothetical protein